MKTVTVVTATRAEYGLLLPVIRKLQMEEDVLVRVAVTGAHLSPQFGLTYRQIEQDGIKIDRKIEMLLSSDSPEAISKSMGLAIISFADYFAECRPDALIVLGDRYEMLAVCIAAMNERIPIAHLHGGETTEGAIDEAVRHSITKMSYLHFTSTEEYRRRVIQLGEAPERVFCVGAPGVENAVSMPLLSKEELSSQLSLDLERNYMIITYHPTTLEGERLESQVNNLLSVLDEYRDMLLIFTKANADTNGQTVNRIIAEYAATHENAVLFDSLGVTRYLSAVKYSAAVVGNSSSGIIEVPSFGVPTVNIGNRQRGRTCAKSVLHCGTGKEEISKAIGIALSSAFQERCRHVRNPYEKENTSEEIVRLLKRELLDKTVDLKKKFYDIIDPT